MGNDDTISCFLLLIKKLVLIQTLILFSRGLDAAAGMEDSDLPNLGGEQNLGLDNPGPKLADFANRPAGNLHTIMHFAVLETCIHLLIL